MVEVGGEDVPLPAMETVLISPYPDQEGNFARKHVRDARDFNNIETRAVIKVSFSYKARRRRKFTPF
jgi:hypothetical protein